MNTHIDLETLSDEALAMHIIKGAQEIQPDAQFASGLEQRLMTASQKSPRSRSFVRSIRVLGTVAAALVLMIILTVNVPPLRAIAQELLNFFTRASSDHTTMEVNPYPPMDTQFFSSVQEAETVLARDFVEPQALPSLRKGNEELRVQVDKVSTNYGGLLVEYEPITVVLDQSGKVVGERAQPFKSLYIWFGQVPKEVAEAQDAMPVGESAHLETVSFQFRGHPVTGQLVYGIWQGGVLSVEELAAAKNGEDVTHDAVWIDDGTLQLMWTDDTTFYSLQFFSQKDMTPADVIRMAESIQ